MPLVRPGDLDVQRTGRGLEIGRLGVAEPGRQVAAGDLLRGPPKVVGRGRSLPLSTGEAVPEVQRFGAGDQLAAQDRLERAGVDVGAEAGGDVLGRGVRLLRGEPALLDREVGAVAGRVDVGDALDPAVLVDRREAVRIGGQARDLRARR